MKKTTNLLNLDELSEEKRQNPLFQSYILSFISSLIADYDNDNTFIFQLLNQQKDMVIGRDSIIRTILVTYLEKFGFEKIYQGLQNEGFQSILLERKSGAIVSVEVIPDTIETVIRSKDYQTIHFDTKKLLREVVKDKPNLDDFISLDIYELPLISLAEEKLLPQCQSMISRIESLPGTTETSVSDYYATGCILGYTDEFVRQLEETYRLDEERLLREKEKIKMKKLAAFPAELQSFYQVDTYNFQYKNIKKS